MEGTMKKLTIIALSVFLLFGCKKEEQKFDQETSLFSSGLLAVMEDDKWGYINEEGDVVIDFIYDRATAFYEDTAIVAIDFEYFLIDKLGNQVFTDRYEYIERSDQDGYLFYVESVFLGIMHPDGTKLTEAIYDSSIYDYEDGLFLLSHEMKIGFIDDEGETVIDFSYDYAYPFSSGYAAVLLDNKWNYIDLEGNIHIDAEAQIANPFDENGLAIIAKRIDNQNVYYLMNTEGEYILEDMQDILGTGPIYAAEKNNTYQLYKKDGTLFNDQIIDHVIEMDQYYIRAFDGGNLKEYLYQSDGSLRVQGMSGSVIYQPLSISDMNLNYYQLIENHVVKLYTDQKMIEIEADEIIQYLANNQFIVLRNDQTGIINSKNEVILAFEYDGLAYTSDGYYLYQKDGLIGFMDHQFNVIVEGTYEAINIFYNTFETHA